MGDLEKSIIVMKSISILVFLLVNITITFHWYLQNVGAISCCLPESYASITVFAIWLGQHKTTWQSFHDVPALSDFFFPDNSSVFFLYTTDMVNKDMLHGHPHTMAVLSAFHEFSFHSTVLCVTSAFWVRGVNNLGKREWDCSWVQMENLQGLWEGEESGISTHIP